MEVKPDIAVTMVPDKARTHVVAEVVGLVSVPIENRRRSRVSRIGHLWHYRSQAFLGPELKVASWFTALIAGLAVCLDEGQ